MNRPIAIAASLLCLPVAALAATRAYETPAFEAVSAAAGVNVEVTLGTSRSVVAETRNKDFDGLRVAVQGNVLTIERVRHGWFQFGRTSYTVRVVTPVLHAVSASAGSDIQVKGTSEGDFKIDASSGSDVQISMLKGGTVKAHASSGSDLRLAGTCVALEVEASSGSDVDAGALKCEIATLRASSGSDVSLHATRSVTGNASSGSDVDVSGSPPVVKVETSSGADVSTVNRR